MGSLLALSRGIDRFNEWIGKAVSWLILIAVLVSAGNAIIRKTMNVSSNAWLELQWYLYGAAFLLAAAYTLKENEHIRIDLVYGMWRRARQHWIDLAGHILFLMPFVTLTLYLMWPWLMRSFNSCGSGLWSPVAMFASPCEMSMNAGGLVLWPAKLLLFSGFVLLWFQGISEIIKKIAIIRGEIEDPHGSGGGHGANPDLASITDALIPHARDEEVK